MANFLEASWWLAESRLLPCEERGALIELLAHAWLNQCWLPAGQDDLAALSGLGERFASSWLLRLWSRWFVAATRPDGQPGVYCQALQAEQQRQARRREGNRRGGQATQSRRRSRVEVELKSSSSQLQLDFKSTSPAGCKTALNPMCGQQFDHERLRKAAAQTVAATCPPPHPPILREEFISSSHSEGCGEDTADQPELFHNCETIPPVSTPTRRPRVRKKANPATDSAARQIAAAIVDYYVLKLSPTHSRRRAEDNVMFWLARGETRESLMAAIDGYAAWARRVGRWGQFVFAPANFFGRKDPEFKNPEYQGSKNGQNHRTGVDGQGRVFTGQNYDQFTKTVDPYHRACGPESAEARIGT